jgi:hypothetical protein
MLALPSELCPHFLLRVVLLSAWWSLVNTLLISNAFLQASSACPWLLRPQPLLWL